MQPDLIGIETVCGVIEASPYTQWRVHSAMPAINQDGQVNESKVKYSSITSQSQAEAAAKFKEWAELVTRHNPNSNTLYYLELCKLRLPDEGKPPFKYTPFIQSFVLGAMYANGGTAAQPINITVPGPTNERQPAPVAAAQSISGYSQEQVDMIVQNERLRIENERLKLERELLEEEDYEEEDEEDENDFLGFIPNKEAKDKIYESLAGIFSGIAQKMMGGAAMAGTEPGIISKLQTIQNASPKAIEVINKLAEIAEKNPEAVDTFMSEILPHLNVPGNEAE
jgi:hypothetical protein